MRESFSFLLLCIEAWACVFVCVCVCAFHSACHRALPVALSWRIPKLWPRWISLKQISGTYSSDGSSIGLQIKTKAAVSPYQRQFPMKSNTLCLSLQPTTDWEASFSCPPLLSSHCLLKPHNTTRPCWSSVLRLKPACVVIMCIGTGYKYISAFLLLES